MWNLRRNKLISQGKTKDINRKFSNLSDKTLTHRQIINIYQGWHAYAKWAKSINLRRRMAKEIYQIKKPAKKITVNIEQQFKNNLIM